MAKLFTVVGIGRVNDNDVAKLRVATGKAESRARRMTWAGHVEVVLFDIEPMTKEKARVWLALNHPALEAQIGKRPGDVVAPKAEVVEVAAEKAQVEVVDVPLSKEAKLALKRAKDAARKREKRRLAREAREAAKAAS